jgi:hypothetical protein
MRILFALLKFVLVHFGRIENVYGHKYYFLRLGRCMAMYHQNPKPNRYEDRRIQVLHGCLFAFALTPTGFDGF